MKFYRITPCVVGNNLKGHKVMRPQRYSVHDCDPSHHENSGDPIEVVRLGSKWPFHQNNHTDPQIFFNC